MLDDADFDMAALFTAFSTGHPRRPGLRAHVAAAGAAASTTTRSSRLIKNNFGLVRYGDPTDPGTYMGPLISEKQRDKVDGMVKRAVEAGATLVTGGEKVDPGYFYTPTLLTDVDPDSEIAQDEVFGPVLVVIALRRRRRRGADRQQLDLRSVRRGVRQPRTARWRWRAASAPARSRSTAAYYFSPDSPFGGYKQSGIGREMGAAGLEEFLERKTFATVVSESGQS